MGAGDGPSTLRRQMLPYWEGIPLQLQQGNRLYRRIRVIAVQLELSRDQGTRFFSLGYLLVTHKD